MTTAPYTPIFTRRPAPLTDVSAATIEQRVAARRTAVIALDSFVRPLMEEKVRLPYVFGRPAIELTVYEQIYRRTTIGGHWTLSSRWTDLIGHTVASYIVALHFDDQDRPLYFVIDGKRQVITADASPEALARGLDEAGQSGPLMVWAPNLVPEISL